MSKFRRSVLLVLLLASLGRGAHAQSSPTIGVPLSESFSAAIKELNSTPINSWSPGTNGIYDDSTEQLVGTYQVENQDSFSATKTGGEFTHTDNAYNNGAERKITVSFMWADIDPTQVTIIGSDIGGMNYAVSINNKSGLTSILNNGGYPSNSGIIFHFQDAATAQQFADLVATAVSKAKATAGSGSHQGPILTETVEKGALDDSDGKNIVNIRNNTSKSVYLTASTEACSNLEVTQCGPQLTHVRVAPKSTVHFWIDREDDTQPWSFTVSCIVNGEKNSDCATGGGGGPHP